MSWKTGLLLAGMGLILSTNAEECNDQDWDNLQDKDDNCASQYNPQQLDTDGDGIGDACDAETTQKNGRLAPCYITNYDNLRGVGWTDVLLVIDRDSKGNQYGVFYWPPGEYPEFGYTSFNGQEFWIMAFGGEGSTLQTATYLEGAAVESDDSGLIMQMEGTYEMLSCEEGSCMYPDDPEYWEQFTDGMWDGVAAYDDDCIPPP